MSQSTEPESPRRRADAERSIARILDAAVEALASDPEATMAEVARRAGVVRATVYMHFPTREALIEAVTNRAINQAAKVIAAAEPERGDPVEALRRVIESAWRTLASYHSLVALNVGLAPEELHKRHRPVLDLLQPLIQRGQGEGAFQAEVPAEWHLSMILALIHAASGVAGAGSPPPEHIESALVASVLGAVSGAKTGLRR